MMKQVMLKSWFPDELRRGEDREATIDNIFRGLCKRGNYVRGAEERERGDREATIDNIFRGLCKGGIMLGG